MTPMKKKYVSCKIRNHTQTIQTTQNTHRPAINQQYLPQTSHKHPLMSRKFFMFSKTSLTMQNMLYVCNHFRAFY